jgi:hypothetical protein
MVSYLGKHGVSRQELAHLAETNIALHHPAFAMLVKDAIAYQRLQNAPKVLAQKQAQHVQRPGSTGVSKSSKDSSFAALQAAFDRNPSEENGWKLLQAKGRR